MQEPQEPVEKPPVSSPLDSELEDEGPGAYLSELGTRRASVVWGLVNLVATGAMGTVAWTARIGPESEWFTLARLVWCLLPVSALLLAIVTVWQLGTAYTKKPPARVLLTLLFTLGCLALWAFFACGLGVLPEPEPLPTVPAAR
jgi:hypothetical protein